jgi:uncharacterized protein HemX
MSSKSIILACCFALAGNTAGWAQTQQEEISVRLTRIEESLKRMEDLLKATNQRMEELNKATNQRMEELNKATNQRIDDSNQRLSEGFNLLGNLLVGLIALITLMLGIAFWIARQDRPIGKKHFDKLIKEKEELGVELGVFEREQRAHSRRQEELAQKVRELEAEVAALKRPATS